MRNALRAVPVALALLGVAMGCRMDEAPAKRDPVLGYQLDISRNKVPTMDTLCRIVDILSKLGYNQFQLYTEHTFAYPQHESVWRDCSPMTPAEVRELDDYCRTRGIEFVPNQNSFGHLENWLRHPEYNDLAEHPQGGAYFERWHRVVRLPQTLCPTDPRCLDFLGGLYDEMLPCYRSRYFNVGCDETLELEDAHGRGRSAEAIRERGAARVYLDFIRQVHDLVAARGHTMMFWGDIILRSPELVKELPEDVVCLNWGYEANHPFEREAAVFESSHRRFIVCPGTSSWCSLSGRTTNMMGNIDNAVAAASRHHAEGLLLTDWGDGGHPQPWIVSVPSLVYLSNLVRGRRLTRSELAVEIDRLLGCKVGFALLEYGEVYRTCGGRMGNDTELYLLLRLGPDYRRREGVSDVSLKASLEHAHRAASKADLSVAPEWVRDDFATLALLYRMVESRIGNPEQPNFRAMFEPEYRRLWLKQNRPGGLLESMMTLMGRFGE